MHVLRGVETGLAARMTAALLATTAMASPALAQDEAAKWGPSLVVRVSKKGTKDKGEEGGKVGLVAGLAAAMLVAAGAGGYFWLNGAFDIAEETTANATPTGQEITESLSGGSQSAQAPVTSEAPPVQVASLPDRALIENEVNEVLGGFQCSGLSATLTDDLRVMVTGYLAGDDDLRQMLTALSSVNGVRGVIESTSIRPWPFCAAIGVLEAQAGIGQGRGHGPIIQLNNDSLIYQQDDSLVIRATAASEFEGYLYVDFIDNEGNVYHLFPTDSRPENRISAGGMIVVGGGPGGFPGDPHLVINPPYGTDMILAISTSVRLFDEPRPFTEPASAYLQALSDGLSALQRRGFETPAAGSYVFITSRPQG